MARVYIANSGPSLDFRKAEKFGELVNVTEGSPSPFNPDLIKTQCLDALRSFNEDDDYLLLAGSGLASAICLLALTCRAVGRVRLLLFDSKKRDYFTRTLSLD